MARHLSITSMGLIVLVLLLGGCNRQPTDIFLPVIIGEATAAPTILDTPAATPTDLPATATPLPSTTPLRTVTPRTPLPAQTGISTPQTPAGTAVGTPRAGTPAIIIRTPRAAASRGTRTSAGMILPTPGISQPARTATATPTTVFRSYLALIVSQLQQAVPPTDTPIPAPIVITPSPTSTPTSTPTATGTPTRGTPTSTPTPFTGDVRLLPRDPVDVTGVIPVVAYADPDNVLEKNWSSFYGQHPENSDFVRIYHGDESRIYGPALALTTTTQWAEGVCMVPSTLVGVQFWGDENDGWARVLVDGAERWRGNTFGQSPEPFVRFLEISNLSSAPHVIRIEPLGQPGTNAPGGNIHVSIYAVVCGLPVESEIFVPILQR